MDVSDREWTEWVARELDRIIDEDDVRAFMELFGEYSEDEDESDADTVIIDVAINLKDNDGTKIDRVN